MSREMVALNGVTKRYDKTAALDIDALSVRPGEFMTLLGASGSGKTTLLNVIAGTVKPDSGTVLIDGRDVTNVSSAARQLGMVFQNYALFPHMTVFENIAYPLRVRRLPEREIRDKVAAALELVRLFGLGTRRPKELSGGQQQRVSIARCLVYNPTLILMDEPLGALDKKLREQMQREIKRLHAELHMTILSVTHDQEEALAMSDRVCLMRAGRIEQLGTPDELYFRPATEYAADFLGESNFLTAHIEAIGPVMHARGPAGVPLQLQPAAEATVGETVNLMIRPERLLPDCPLNHLDGTVEEIVFVGGTMTIVTRLTDETRIKSKVLTTGGSSWRPGDRIRLGFVPEAARVFRR
jgi:putative spermidine/putrescine transport system ATP-binding protein